MLLLLPILIPIFAVPLTYFVGKKSLRVGAFLHAMVLVVVLSIFCILAMGDTTALVFRTQGVYPFSLKLDGFRLVQALLAGVLWCAAAGFSKEYFQKTRAVNLPRYRGADLLTLGAVLGVFLSANLFTLFIFFEIMSFSSYGWVVHDETPFAKKAGASYLTASVVSGMVMLMGLFLLDNTLGTLELDAMKVAMQHIRPSEIYLPGGLILVGFGTKAAMFPFHFWLSKAYPAAPAPATSLLSGILSKAGIYGIIVLSTNAFLHDVGWGAFLLIMGTITMFWGGICALCAGDMKKIVSFSSMSQIGFILVGIGMQGLLGTENALAVRGTFMHMLNHSIIKLMLFTLCGIVVMNLGTTRLSKIKGYGRKNPIFAGSFIIAALGLCGMPLFGGYVSKTLLHESIVEYAHLLVGGKAVLMGCLEWVFLLSGGLTVAYMGKIGFVLFSPKPVSKATQCKQSPLTSLCLILPALAVLLIGLFPNFLADPLMDLTQGMMYGQAPAHGVAYFSPVNLLGAATSIVLGLCICVGILLWERKRKFSFSNLMSAQFDLEVIVYRPFLRLLLVIIGATSVVMDRYVLAVLTKIALFVITLYGRITASVADWLLEFLVLFGFRTAKPRSLAEKRIPVAYRLGRVIDRTAVALHREPRKGMSYAQSFVKYEKQSALRRRMIAGSLSYGLFFAGIGLVIVMLYLLLA